MPSRHPAQPTAWLITDERLGPELLRLIAKLPRRTGVLVRHHDLPARERAALLRKIRKVAASRELVIVDEAGGSAARTHSPKEIARARLGGAALLLISPVYGTRSHPEWRPLPRMRAAALARLAGRRAIALGGMDARRFRTIAPLGFTGWAGIDAWL